MKLGGDPFHAAHVRRQEEERMQKVGPNDGENLLCRTAYFLRARKTLGGSAFMARERLVIVRFSPYPFPTYTLQGGGSPFQQIECRRKDFRLAPLPRRMREKKG